MLPDLSDALSQTREAYQKGRYSYVEWTAAQRELLSARQALVAGAESGGEKRGAAQAQHDSG